MGDTTDDQLNFWEALGDVAESLASELQRPEKGRLSRRAGQVREEMPHRASFAQGRHAKSQLAKAKAEQKGKSFNAQLRTKRLRRAKPFQRQ